MQFQGTLTLIQKGEVSAQLTSLSLPVRNQLHQESLEFVFHFQNNLVINNKDEEDSRTDTSLAVNLLMLIKKATPWCLIA